MLKKYLILVFVSLAIFSIGCDGPKGDVGPVGPKGDTGETGATGPAGADAENPDQTAFFYTNGTKVTDSLGNLEIKYANFFQGSTAEGIKSADGGAFLIYIKTGGSWYAIPGLVSFPDSSFTQYSFHYSIVNNLDLKFNIVKVSSSEGSSNIKTFDDVRIVMIPGRVRLSAGTNWNKYEETIQALGLSEKDVKIFK